MKRWLSSPVISKMQIKSTVTYCFTLVRILTIVLKQTNKQKITSINEDVEKLEPLCIAGKNAKWWNRYKK